MVLLRRKAAKKLDVVVVDPSRRLSAAAEWRRRSNRWSPVASSRISFVLWSLAATMLLHVATHYAPIALMATTTRLTTTHAFTVVPSRPSSHPTQHRSGGGSISVPRSVRPSSSSSIISRRAVAGGNNQGHGGGGGGGSHKPPSPPNGPGSPPPRHGEPTPDDDPNAQEGFVVPPTHVDEEEEEEDDESVVENGDRHRHVSVRGGAAASSSAGQSPDNKKKGKSRPARTTKNNNNVVRGTQATLATTANFWSDAVQKFTSTVSEPFKKLAPKNVFKSEKAKRQEELLHQLKTMPVQRIRVPNTTVLPPDVVQVAAKRCQLLGSALRMDRVQEFAATLGRWYARQGYVLHGVTGATLVPETATAEIAVVEPKVHKDPVDILFVKEMVVVETNDNTSNGEGNSQPQLLTLRQYKDMYNKDPQRRRRMLLSKGGGGGASGDEIRKQDLNTTFVTTSGRVKSAVIAAAMGLRPGTHFCWNSGQWQRIVQSPLFAKILQAKPAQMQDGTVQLQMIVQEAPLRHLEYGVGKSLYTNSWEGELEFEHLNLLGGGETLGVTVKRGTSEAAPSGKITFGNAKFGNPGGYQVQLFRDFLGHHGKSKSTKGSSTKVGNGEAAPNDDAGGGVTVESPPAPAVDVHGDSGTTADAQMVAEVAPSDSTETSISNDDVVEDSGLFDRKGLSFRIRNPIPQRIMYNSAGSATVERTSAVNGRHENICSTTLSLGPFVRQLPYDARSNVDATITTGTRVSLRHADDMLTTEVAKEEGVEATPSSSTASSSILDRAQFLPYSTVTASMKQMFPLTQSSSRRISQPQQAQSRRPIVLALRHSVSTSSRHTPSYEAQALGNSVNIRGGEPNGNVKSCLRGTTELRVPITVPDFTKLLPRIGGGGGGAAPTSTIGDGSDSPSNPSSSGSSALSVPNAGASVATAARNGFATASNPIRQDASLVLFGDWLVAAQDSTTTPLFRKTSVGVGIRKSIQGIPLSLDLTYSKELKFKTSFGLGRDFDV